MQSLDVLYYALALSALTLSAGLLYLIYHLVQTIREMQQVVSDITSVTHDLEAMKDSLKRGVAGKMMAFTSLFSRNK